MCCLDYQNNSAGYRCSCHFMCFYNSMPIPKPWCYASDYLLELKKINRRKHRIVSLSELNIHSIQNLQSHMPGKHVRFSVHSLSFIFISFISLILLSVVWFAWKASLQKSFPLECILQYLESERYSRWLNTQDIKVQRHPSQGWTISDYDAISTVWKSITVCHPLSPPLAVLPQYNRSGSSIYFLPPSPTPLLTPNR